MCMHVQADAEHAIFSSHQCLEWIRLSTFFETSSPHSAARTSKAASAMRSSPFIKSAAAAWPVSACRAAACASVQGRPEASPAAAVPRRWEPAREAAVLPSCCWPAGGRLCAGSDRSRVPAAGRRAVRTTGPIADPDLIEACKEDRIDDVCITPPCVLSMYAMRALSDRSLPTGQKNPCSRRHRPFGARRCG